MVFPTTVPAGSELTKLNAGSKVNTVEVLPVAAGVRFVSLSPNMNGKPGRAGLCSPVIFASKATRLVSA